MAGAGRLTGSDDTALGIAWRMVTAREGRTSASSEGLGIDLYVAGAGSLLGGDGTALGIESRMAAARVCGWRRRR
jgi:hypothetical protein